ncbi:MAG: D-alanyl-D-alanine carboxypeptidase/D-alanyl-D-alanine endopeptidase [Casimicrobiaceae bacterium]
MMRRIAFACGALCLTTLAHAELPRAVGRAFLDAGIPLNSVALVVQEVGRKRPLFAYAANRPMNPASVMKLVTTFASLELLGRDFRWKTEAFLSGPLIKGVLYGDLILKGYGDPKITIEQWQLFMATLRQNGLERITGDLVLDRTHFKLSPHDPAEFDHAPLRPYNVGPDALLVNFKSVRFAFAANAAGDAIEIRMDPALSEVELHATPHLSPGDCLDWRTAVGALFVDRGPKAEVWFPGHYAASCGERDLNVALLDHVHYVRAMFASYFRAAGGEFAGGVRDGRVPHGAASFAVLHSAPLYDIVRDVNKLSNNVMARQMFLTLATARYPPPATIVNAAAAARRWLAARKIAMPGLVLENGSGLSRHERATAGGLAQLLAAANASPVREEFASSLAVAAVDGTLARRFLSGNVAGQALLKTGSLEGVRALSGYVIDADGRRWIVVAIINHVNAQRGAAALDFLVQWVYRNARAWNPALQR